MMKPFNHPCFEYSELLKEGEIVAIPTKKQVCPSCGGVGTHERRDIDCSLMVDSMREDGDEDGLAGYFAGDYDVACQTCGGRNVIDELDMDYFVEKYPELYAEMCDWDASEAEDARYAAQERAMGA
jgi:hypothetical protein